MSRCASGFGVVRRGAAVAGWGGRMETLNTLRKLFDYDAWANREALGSLRAAGNAPEHAVEVLAHVAGAQQVWLTRLRGDQTTPATWPHEGLDRIGAQFDELAANWRAYLAVLRPEDLAKHVSYANSKGEAFSSPIDDILLQLATHGSYHRGQVAVLLRSAGKQPAATDYIRAARQGVIR